MHTPQNDKFTPRIQAVYEYTEALSEKAKSTDTHRYPQIVLEYVEELRVALEELHIAEEELREQHEALISAYESIAVERQRYQDLFEFAPDAYVVTDTHGLIREANQVAASLFDVEHRYLLSKPIVNFIPEEQRRSFRVMLNQLPSMRRIQEWEMMMCQRNGASFDAALTVETVYEDGQPSGLRWLIRNVTARKQAEARLQQMQLQNLELMESDRLKNQFIANISHELRTPMNAILGFSELIQRHLQKNYDPHLAGMIERVFRNGRHLLALIEELLDLSRLKSAQLKLHPEPLDVVELVTLVMEELQPLVEQKAIDLQLHTSQDCIAIVNDPTRLRQIVVNLISNAIKFTDQGSVQVEIRELPKQKIALIVQDTGIGIAESDLPKIFCEFWQVNASTTRSQSGTGLGLAIVQAIVNLMQGSISVESQLGREQPFGLKSRNG
ncbi:sensor histidine kinase [Egbenema bharatensis]|uniref:sensor histidine kinase n=1 Tax=Egbenema bharatensis TaxID=3463334 RepID=UPI003A8BB58F